VKEYPLQWLLVFRYSEPTTSVRREYHGISLTSSTPLPRYHTDCPITEWMALYELSHYLCTYYVLCPVSSLLPVRTLSYQLLRPCPVEQWRVQWFNFPATGGDPVPSLKLDCTFIRLTTSFTQA